MHIDERDVFPISMKDVVDYDGEELILPIQFTINDFIKNGEISISKKITPVFLALALTPTMPVYDTETFFTNERNVNYFLKHSPIGCRDEYSYNVLRTYGIPAYINGCLTISFPRKDEPLGEYVFFVDAPKDLLPYIPPSLLKNKIDFATQQFYFNESDIKDFHKIFSFVRTKYEFYKKNAKMIITSRLHIALPCTAFGIPVVLAKDNVDERFSFIEAFIPIYSKENYQNIDWQPNVPNTEPIKKQMTDFAISRIKSTMENAKFKSAFTSLYTERPKREEYKNPHIVMHKNGYRFEEYADKYWKNRSAEIVEYALWGASPHVAKYWKDLIETKYPNAKLSAVFDRYKKGEVFGLPLKSPESLSKMNDVCVIVCAISAASDALQLFKRLEIGEERYCIVSDCFISMDDLSNRSE